MSKKHNQRTRAEILAKRQKPIKAWAGWKAIFRPAVIATRYTADALRGSRSKYTPHFGAKQQAKLQKLAQPIAAEVWNEYDSVF